MSKLEMAPKKDLMPIKKWLKYFVHTRRSTRVGDGDFSLGNQEGAQVHGDRDVWVYGIHIDNGGEVCTYKTFEKSGNTGSSLRE